MAGRTAIRRFFLLTYINGINCANELTDEASFFQTQSIYPFPLNSDVIPTKCLLANNVSVMRTLTDVLYCIATNRWLAISLPNIMQDPPAKTNWGQTQIAKFMGPTWDPPGSCRPQVGPMLTPGTLLSWKAKAYLKIQFYSVCLSGNLGLLVRHKGPPSSIYC